MIASRRLSPDDIERARRDHPISHVLALLGTPPPAGWNGHSDYRICCPTPGHADEHPSCLIHPSTARFHCFACGAGGDIFTLVRDATGLTNLADIADLLDTGHSLRAVITHRVPRAPAVVLPTIERPDPNRTPRERVLQINTEAWALFTSPLRAHVAHRYLDRRGIDTHALTNTIGTGYAGYTPASRYGLTHDLRAHGVTDTELIDAGWATRRDDQLLDRFRRRVLFPIRDQHGQLLGVIGRDITGIAHQKYLNTADTIAFHKGTALYQPATPVLAPDATVIVCEGALDALAITVAAAVTRVTCRIAAVAPSGTALTAQQAALIRDIGASTVTICADGDSAGQSAAKAWTERLTDGGCVRVRTVALPDGHDPASLLLTRGPNGLLELVPDEVSAAATFGMRSPRTHGVTTW